MCYYKPLLYGKIVTHQLILYLPNTMGYTCSNRGSVGVNRLHHICHFFKVVPKVQDYPTLLCYISSISYWILS